MKVSAQLASWYRKSADQGNTVAENYLGYSNMLGHSLADLA